MLLYLLFWTILGFIFHFYIIFGTNLLTRGPARIAIFFAYFSFSKERNIKRSPNGMEPSEAIFLEQMRSRRLGPCSKEQKRWSRGWGRAPCLVGPSLLLRRTSSSYIYTRTLKTSREQPKYNFHRRNLLYPRDPILEPSHALRRRGNRPSGASTSTP